MTVTMFGSAIPISDEWYNDTFNIGKRLAESGHTLLYGGGSTGEMGAISEGWRAGGGTIIGVVPAGYADEWKEELNPLCNKVLYTDTINSRKEVLHTNADIQLVFPGSYGTFDELFSALCRYRYHINFSLILIYNQDGFYDKLIEFLEDASDKFGMLAGGYKVFDNQDDLINYINFIDNKNGSTN